MNIPKRHEAKIHRTIKPIFMRSTKRSFSISDSQQLFILPKNASGYSDGKDTNTEKRIMIPKETMRLIIVQITTNSIKPECFC